MSGQYVSPLLFIILNHMWFEASGGTCWQQHTSKQQQETVVLFICWVFIPHTDNLFLKKKKSVWIVIKSIICMFIVIMLIMLFNLDAHQMHSDSAGPLCLRLEFDCACLTPHVSPTEITVNCYKHCVWVKASSYSQSLTLFHISRGAAGCCSPWKLVFEL